MERECQFDERIWEPNALYISVLHLRGPGKRQGNSGSGTPLFTHKQESKDYLVWPEVLLDLDPKYVPSLC